MDLNGKVAIVTGAASGMGAGIATAFVLAGAQTVLADIQDTAGGELAESLGANARYLHLDVTSASDWDAAVAFAAAEFGPVSVLANVAGIGDGGPIETTTLEAWHRVLDVNQTGVFLGMRAVVPTMRAQRAGSIINISSTDGLQGGAQQAAYVASKWAVRGLTKGIALEVGRDNIRVNSIHPGGIDTPMLESAKEFGMDVGAIISRLAILGRLGTPAEVGNLATFLASDASSYCTGSEFVIDGGLTAGYAPEVFFGS
jgi:3alpha(or 20beta)-hydroxysteroid dehydrogenase